MSLKFYKTSISLPDFVLQSGLGFVIDPSSTNHNVRLTKYTLDKEGSRVPKVGGGFEKEQSLLFKKKADGTEIYFDFINDDVVGTGKHHTIVDFVSEHIFGNPEGVNPDWVKLSEHLDTYMKSDQFVPPGQSNFNLKEYSKAEGSADIVFDNVLKPPGSLNDAFFKHRSIPKEVYSLNMFEHTYGVHEKTVMTKDAKLKQEQAKKENKGVENVDLKKDVVIVRNHSFYFKNNEGKVVAVQDCYVKDGETVKLYSGDRGRGLWISDFNNDKKQDRVMILGESPQDMIAHFTVNEHRLKSVSVCYAAYGGAIAFPQLQQTQALLEKRNIKTVTLAFDNNIAGKQYSVLCAANFSLNLQNQTTLPIKVSLNKGVTRLTSATHHGEMLLLDLSTQIHKSGELLKSVSENKEIGKIFDKGREGAVLTLPGDDVFVFKVLLPMLSNQNDQGLKYSTHRSVQSDWNEQLQNNLAVYGRVTIAEEQGGLKRSVGN